MLTQVKLREILHYNKKTGIFTWKKHPSKNKQHLTGSCAGSEGSHGYIDIQLLGERHLAHRLAWFYVKGVWPEQEIDHKNRKKTDNRWRNLREASRRENMLNVGKSVKNTSGYKGVTYHKASGKWMAQAELNGVHYYLGLYPTPELAAEAYRNWCAERHGEFMMKRV